MGDMKLTYTEVARRAGIPRATVHAIATREQVRQRPKPETLDAIAGALELPPELLREAAIEAAGYGFEVAEVVEDDRLRAFVATVRQLDDRDRETLSVIAQEFLERARREPPPGEPAP